MIVRGWAVHLARATREIQADLVSVGRYPDGAVFLKLAERGPIVPRAMRLELDRAEVIMLLDRLLGLLPPAKRGDGGVS